MKNNPPKHKQHSARWFEGFLTGMITCVVLIWLVLRLNKHYPISELNWVSTLLPVSLLILILIYITLSWAKRDKHLLAAKKLIKAKKLDDALNAIQQCQRQDKTTPILYRLAIQFQKQKQFDKAISIFETIAEYAPQYQDVQNQIKHYKSTQDAIVVSNNNSSELHDFFLNEEEKTLGRYEIKKELGKGAMGTVYLGKDPKINRIVAIKTMPLLQEFDIEELENVKSRFFREAETAGRLIHPNIVTIFDVGEENNLAYISMEYLEGHDLTRYTKTNKLLPIKTALQLITLAAEALDYAHKQNVVHRDIKPANIMLLPKTSTIKITDFGIARITDASKTKTGMVLGSPSYMSPEQLTGKHIDGRSDLFSLGIMLFQLLCGQLPFKGDSMASLMFSIANEPHPEIIGLRKGLDKTVPEINLIIDKALEKTPENRYQTGEELAIALRNHIKNIKKNK